MLIFNSRSSMPSYVLGIFFGGSGLPVFLDNLIALSNASMTFSNFVILFPFLPLSLGARI